MPAPSAHPDRPPAATCPFPSISCGVDGTRAGFEAARQAAMLAGDDVALRYIAVSWETGTLAGSMVELGRHRAEEALERARTLARELGVKAEGELIDGPHAADKLLAAAAGDDLLVVGSSGRSHTGGLILGRAADQVLRHAPGSVLVARRPSTGAFPASILVAVDDAESAAAAAGIAGTIARQHGGVVTVLAGDRAVPAVHHAVAEAGAAIRAATGVEPVVVDGHGRFHAAAAHVAGELGAALIVTTGAHAVRIAECARCSVLVLRQGR